jgi:hypothetical protein
MDPSLREETFLSRNSSNNRGMFGGLARAPHHATLRLPRVWRPNRPPQVRHAVASTTLVQTSLRRITSHYTTLLFYRFDDIQMHYFCIYK